MSTNTNIPHTSSTDKSWERLFKGNWGTFKDSTYKISVNRDDPSDLKVRVKKQGEKLKVKDIEFKGFEKKELSDRMHKASSEFKILINLNQDGLSCKITIELIETQAKEEDSSTSGKKIKYSPV